MQFYFNRNKNDGNFTKENKKFFRIMRRESDLYDIKEDNDSNCLINDKKIVDYANKFPEKTNIQIFKELGYPVPEGSQINNNKLNPEMFYKKNDNGELIPKKNMFCKKKDDPKNENIQKSFCSIINSSNNDDSFLNSKKSPFKKREKSSRKKLKRPNFTNSRNSCFFGRSDEEIEKIQFKHCMDYYCGFFNHFSKDKKSVSESIQCLGQIYYLVKFPIYNSIIKYDFKNSSIINNISSNKNEGYLNSLKKFVNWVQNNNAISEKNFLSGDLSFTQLAHDLSQNLNLLSKNSNDDIIMKSIREENANNDEVSMESIKNNNKSLNKIDQNNLNEYDIMLLLKGRRIRGQTSENIKELIAYIKRNNYFEDGNNNRKKEEKKYFFRLFIGDIPLAPVEIINSPKKSNISNLDFEKIMDKVKIQEEIIIAFVYNPIYYFDINTGKYKGNNSDCQKIYFIDCSKNNPKLYDLYLQINDYKEDEQLGFKFDH